MSVQKPTFPQIILRLPNFWAQHPRTVQASSRLFETRRFVTIPFTFALAGIPTDTSLVRAEIEL